MTDFSTARMMVHSTERIALGLVDPRGFVGTCDAERVFDDLPHTIFRSEAEHRGYDLALWDEHVPKGFGHAGNGRIV